MFALDLFNTKYEQELAEGAVDNLEARRIDILNDRMDDLIHRASVPNNREAREALMNEYNKVKAERDSYYKVNTSKTTNEMGYGSVVGENDQIPVGRMQPGTPEYATARNRSVKYAELTPDYTGGHKTAGPTTVGYKKATNKPLVPGEVEVAEAGLPGNLPPEQIPGKEDLLKGRGRQTYESQKKKSDPDLDSGTARDATVQRELQKLRGRHPNARSDIEALVKDEIVQQQQDAKAFGSIRNVNSKQDDLLKQIIALDKQQGDEINHLDQENSALEKELKDVEAVNDRLSQTVSSMTGTKQSTRPKTNSTNDKKSSSTTSDYSAPISTSPTTATANQDDKETPTTSGALSRMASQLTTPKTVHNPSEKAAAKKASAADSAARNAFGAIANTSTINPDTNVDPNQPDLFNPTNKDRQRELPLSGGGNVIDLFPNADAETAQANRNYSGSNASAFDQPLPNTRGTGAAGAAVLHPNFGNNAYKALAKHHSADDLVSAPNDPYKTGTHSKNESQLNEFGDVIQMPGTQANAAELPGQQQATKIAISIVSLILRGDPTNQSPQLRNDLQRLGYRLRFDKPGIRLINDKYNKQVPIPINLFPRDVQQALAAPPEAVDETIEPGEEMSTNELLYRAAVEYMKHRGEAGQPVDYETAIKLAAKHYHIPYRPGMVPELHNKRVELDAKLDAAIRARQAERASRKQKQLARTAPTTPEQEKRTQEYWATHAPQATRVKAPTRSLEEDQQLHVGDPIIVDYPNEFDGMTGEIIGFGQGNKFVIVRLYNHDEPVSMHSSDVKYNEYANDQDEKEFWNGDNEVNESNMSELDAMAQDLNPHRMNDRQFLKAYGISKVAFRQKYRALLNPAPQQDIPVEEGFQDFNKVEPYAVCLAGKPVKKFDYYEEARRFHDNWKKKLYREGNKAKADKITLMPLNLDEATPRHFGPKGAGTELARQIRANGDTNWVNDLSKDQLNALAGPRYPKRPKIQVKKKKGVAEGKGLAKKVKIVKGPDAGKTGWIREVKHGAFKGAPKTYYIDLDDGGQANNLPATALRLVKEQGMAEGSEQQYLWHGSRQKIPMLEPRQSVDTGGAAGSNQNAIYATSDPKVAIAMGLTTPGSDTGMFPNDPQMVLFSGKIRKGENVYLHKVPMNGPNGKPQFVQGGNSREFHSVPGVKGIKPTEIKAVPVDKYLNLIRQATPQDLELRKKYMKQGVAESIDTQAYYIVNANKNYSILAGPFASREQGRAEFQKIIHQYPGDLKDLSLLQGHVLQQSQKDALDEPDSKEPWHGIKDPELLKDLIADAQVMDYDEFYDEYSSMFDDPEEFWDNYHNGEQGVAEGQQPMNRDAVIQKLEAIYTKLYKDEDPENYDLPAAVMYWRGLSPDELAMEFEDAIAKLKQSRSVTEDTGSWIVYDPKTRQIRKRFKTHTAGKSYAKVHGLGFASSEYYFDRVKDNKEVAETSPEKLARYKKAAGADATAADKRGDFERGNKRFKGIVRATNKEFDKGRAQGMAEGKWSNVIHTTDRSDEKAQREQEHKKQAGLAATVLKNHSQALDPKEINLLTRYNLHHRGKPGVRFDRLDNEKAQQLIQNVLRFNQQGVAEAQTDYQKRRQRERDVDAGRPVKPLPKNPQTDYARKRAKDRKDMELGETHEPQKFIITINGKSTSPLYADMADRLYIAAKRAQPNARVEKTVAPTTERQKGIDRVKAGYGDEDALELHEQLPSTPPANRKEYLDQRDKLFRMLAVDTNPVNKQIIKQALKDLDNRYGSIKNPVNEENSTSSEAVEIALIRRVLVAHTDLIMNFGLDKVTQAIEEVAYNVGDVDEIGTSDVSGWIHQVKQILGVE